MPRRAVFLTALLLALPAAADEVDDRRENYYYPPVNSEERFSRTIEGAPDADRAVRVGFIVEVTRAQLQAPENPRFAVFAKGTEAQHMIMTALDDQVFSTLYRARAQMAQLTANARGTAFFQKAGIAENATWYDLVKLLGFVDIVITDGETWAHRVVLQ